MWSWERTSFIIIGYMYDVCEREEACEEARGELGGVDSLFPLRVHGMELRLSGWCGKS